MKKIALTIAIVLGSIVANAQVRPEMHREGKYLYILDQELSPDQVLELVGDYNYNQTYIGAQKQFASGKRLIISGAVIGFAGIVTAVVGVAAEDQSTYSIGVCTAAVGDICLSVGVPLFCVGRGRLNWLAEDFNLRNGYAQSAASPDVQVSFGATKNGVGLRMNF